MNFSKSFYDDEYLYLAGPMPFYPDNGNTWKYLRVRAEQMGFNVALPNDNELRLDHEDIRKNADAIFENCAKSINVSTAILASLVTFRGCEPDGGTVFEVGMAYARGCSCYGYSPDMRKTYWKYQGAQLRDGKVYDLDGRILPFGDLPFSPNLVGACTLVEGDIDDCLRIFKADIDRKRKQKAKRKELIKDPTAEINIIKGNKPVIFLAGKERYDEGCKQRFEEMKDTCRTLGFEPYSPIDWAPGVNRIESDDPYACAFNLFDNWQQHVRNCDVFLGDYNDFHGWEPNSDVAFEAGMAWQLGKKCFGYMTDTTNMIGRLQHYGKDEDGEYRDLCGFSVEDFNYPINLMFSSSMPIFEGGFDAVIAQTAEACREAGIIG